MAFIKRLSDSLWELVSPRKSNAPLPTPQTESSFHKKPKYPASARKPSLDEIERAARSMSPSERVKDWRVQSPSSQASSAPAGRKRKRLHTPSSSGRGGRFKQPRIDVEDMEDMEYRPQTPVIADYDGDSTMEDQYEEHDAYLRTPSQRFSRTKSPTLDDMASDMDGMSLVANDEAYHSSPPRRKVVALPKEFGVLEDSKLREKGWDDDYINLIHRIAMRGYEPLLPRYMKFEYNFLPDGLFDATDNAVIRSVRGNHFRASKALEKLFDLGGRIRDREFMDGEIEPEEEVRRAVKNYVAWADYDGGLDRATAIPVLVQEYQPAGTDAQILKDNAEAKCRELAKRWKDAFRVLRSVEFSPGSRSSNQTLLSYEMPTFYAIVASYTIVAVMAYRVDVDECEPMAYFDYKDKSYDVWNSLALAITICHARDVQCRIADETMIGQKRPGSRASYRMEDPDA